MIDESLVENSLTNYRPKRRVSEELDILEQAWDAEEILEEVNIEFFSRERHFVALSESLFHGMYGDAFATSHHAQSWVNDDNSHGCARE